MAQAKTRQPQGPATGKLQASAKANRAKAKPAATRPVKPLRTLNKTKTHRVRNFICAVIAFIFALAALLGTVTHILPEELQALPYMPIVVSLVPWFTLLAVIALVCAIVSKRTVSIVMAVLAIALQAFWQYPFFYQPSKLPRAAVAAASGETVNTDDGYARLMTCNVYKGRADAREIVDLVRSEHVEVLALQETTDAFVDDLNRAGIASYLPYAQVSSSDGVYGNGLWSASPLTLPMTMSIRARRSMPGGTVFVQWGARGAFRIRAPASPNKNDYWHSGKRSLDELAKLRFDYSRRYVFVGKFQHARHYDHTPFRNILGNRFSDTPVRPARN